MDKVDGPDTVKSEWIKLEILMGPDNQSSKYSRKFAIFKDGCKFQRSGSSGWWPSVRLRTWCPWRNLRTRPGCFGLCWRVKPYFILNIISWGGYINLVIWSRSRVNTVCAWVSTSCLFLLCLLLPYNIFLFHCLCFATWSIHQETQAVKFNCICTSGLTDCSCLLSITNSIVSCTSELVRLQLSSTNFSSSIVTVLQDISGYNHLLHFFIKFRS
jgi:hypothetical protein